MTVSFDRQNLTVLIVGLMAGVHRQQYLLRVLAQFYLNIVNAVTWNSQAAIVCAL